jgi:hypothetical protein
MRRLVRENALSMSVAACGCATMAWLGLYGFAWNDYANEAQPALSALVRGHLLAFLRLAPAYGGSLVERAPFALLPGLWGGGELAVYRMVALPGLLAAAALGVWLLARMRSDGHSTLARAVALGVCVANPVTLPTLELGHAEELLGASLCVAALLLACGARVGRSRAVIAGVLLGLAIANKEWAVLAVGPVLLALSSELRLRCLAGAVLSATVVVAPLALVSGGGFVASTRALASPASTIFQPWQLWWFLGHHGALVHGAFGVAKPGYRTPPAWTGAVSHPLILLLAFALPALLWLRSRRLCERDALLALALLLLARCLLDTWDTVYYPLPFLFALLAWEVRGTQLRPPLLTLCASVLVWLSFQWLPEHVSADAQAAVFLAWSLPLAAWLCLRLWTPSAHGAPGQHPGRPREITLSSLGRPSVQRPTRRGAVTTRP